MRGRAAAHHPMTMGVDAGGGFGSFANPSRPAGQLLQIDFTKTGMANLADAAHWNRTGHLA